MWVFFFPVFEVALFAEAGEDSICIFVDFNDPLILGVFFEVKDETELRVCFVVEDSFWAIDSQLKLVEFEEEHAIVGEQDL